MGKPSKLTRRIAELEAEKATYDAQSARIGYTIAELKAVQTRATPARRPKPVPALPLEGKVGA